MRGGKGSWRGRRRSISGAAAIILFGFVAGCGGDDSTGPGSDNDPADGPFSATIDGVAVAALESTQSPAFYLGPGLYSITGTLGSGTNVQSIAFTLRSIVGPGTYPLGTGANVSGGTAIYASVAGGWGTPLSGDAGVIVITELTESRIKATFSFQAEATTGGATGIKSITDGSLDLAVNAQGQVGPVPDRERNVIQASIGAEFWNAATVATTGSPSSALVWVASNTRHSLTMTLRNLTGPGTFDIPSPGSEVTIAVGSASSGVPCCWNSSQEGATGKITVTSLTSTRCTGTFDVTLPAVAGTDAMGDVVVSSGEFDIGFP